MKLRGWRLLPVPLERLVVARIGDEKMKCTCGKELKLPALFIGYTEFHTPVAQFQCGCGKATNVQIETMKPYTAKLGEGFPPPRGDYAIYPDGKVQFTCPVCKGSSPIAEPVHQVGDDGKVTPSVVCPYGWFSYMDDLGGLARLSATTSQITGGETKDKLAPNFKEKNRCMTRPVH
jgi:hypothetical protein